MTRDLDLIRDLLAQTDEEEFSSTDPVVIHHASLLKQAGLIEAVITPHQWRDRFALAIFKRITPVGRQFLRASKDEALWRRTKRNFDQPGIIFSLSIIADYLQSNRHTSSDSLSALDRTEVPTTRAIKTPRLTAKRDRREARHSAA